MTSQAKRPEPNPWKNLATLPTTLDVNFSDKERVALRELFSKKSGVAQGESLDSRIMLFPNVDFAALPPDKKNTPHENAVHKDLTAEQLHGILQLAKFTLCVWNMGNRDRIPVLFLNGKPHALRSYQPPNGEAENQATLVFDDGEKTLAMSPKDALAEFKKQGCHYGTVRMQNR